MKKLFSVFVIFLALGMSLSAQTRPMRIGGQIGIAMPLGSGSDIYKLGFNINGLFIYNLQPNLDLTGQLGYISLGSKESGLDYSFSTVPLLVGGRYSFASGSTFIPYVGAEIGLFFSSAKATIPGFSYLGFTQASQTVSTSSTNFGFVPQAGMTYPITPDLMLDANVKFNIITGSDGSTNIFGINAGVTYGL